MTQAPGWYPDPDDPSRNMYWDGRTWHRNGEPPYASISPPPAITQQTRKPPILWIVIGLVVLAFLASKCSSSDKKSTDNSSSATSTTTAATPAPTRKVTPAPTADNRPPPTDAEAIQPFQAYIRERAAAGVMLAQAVTSVTIQNGVVTVTLDASPTLLEVSPFNNLAEFFGSPVKVRIDGVDPTWLRETVKRVDVVNADGTSLGSMTAEDLYNKATGRPR